MRSDHEIFVVSRFVIETKSYAHAMNERNHYNCYCFINLVWYQFEISIIHLNKCTFYTHSVVCYLIVNSNRFLSTIFSQLGLSLIPFVFPFLVFYLVFSSEYYEGMFEIKRPVATNRSAAWSTKAVDANKLCDLCTQIIMGLNYIQLDEINGSNHIISYCF